MRARSFNLFAANRPGGAKTPNPRGCCCGRGRCRRHARCLQLGRLERRLLRPGHRLRRLLRDRGVARRPGGRAGGVRRLPGAAVPGRVDEPVVDVRLRCRHRVVQQPAPPAEPGRRAGGGPDRGAGQLLRLRLPDPGAGCGGPVHRHDADRGVAVGARAPAGDDRRAGHGREGHQPWQQHRVPARCVRLDGRAEQAAAARRLVRAVGRAARRGRHRLDRDLRRQRAGARRLGAGRPARRAGAHPARAAGRGVDRRCAGPADRVRAGGEELRRGREQPGHPGDRRRLQRRPVHPRASSPT